MNRFPSNRLRVEFDGPDVSQEVLYELFRVSSAICSPPCGSLPTPSFTPAIRTPAGHSAADARPSRYAAVRRRLLLEVVRSDNRHQHGKLPQ
jgi:hypothetical protein